MTERVETLYSSNGSLFSITFYKDDKVHRSHDVGPARIVYFDGCELGLEKPCLKVYFEDNLRHRPCEHGPAEIHIDEHGHIYCEVYYEYGELKHHPFKSVKNIRQIKF